MNKPVLALCLAAMFWTLPQTAAAQPSRCAPLKNAVTAPIRASEASLREFAWAEMADFFATAKPGQEPRPHEDRKSTSAAIRLEEALLEVPAARREAIRALSHESTIDRLSTDGRRRRHRALRGLPFAAISALLEADDPSVRANTWLWLATPSHGTCTLQKLEQARFAAALGDLSEVVESGDDLLLRRVGDYALLAYLRRLSGDSRALDALLLELADEDNGRTLPPRMRAFAAALLVRRAHFDRVGGWLLSNTPEIRLAVAIAALDSDLARWRPAVLELAANDDDDLVTQGIVDAILDRHKHTTIPAELATENARLAEATLRWQGEGDPRFALPVALAKAVAPTPRGYNGLLAAR